MLGFDRWNLLADKFLSFDPDKMTVDGFTSNPNSSKYTGSGGDDIVPVASTSAESRYMHERVDNSTKSAGPVAALKELVSSCFNCQLLNKCAL